MSGLSGQYPLSELLECAGLARSSYYYALSHPKAPTRPELWEAAAEIFSRTANGVSVNLFFTSWDCGGNPGPNRNRKEAACTALSRERSR